MTYPHDYDFDPTYGYRLPSLLQVPAPPGPDDFADFWQATFAEAADVPPEPTHRRIGAQGRFGVHEIEFDAWGGRRLGGWLIVPADGDVRRAVVQGHGYGGRSEPDMAWAEPGAAVLMHCSRGFHRSAFDDLPDVAAEHVRQGIDRRETYVHRGCAADVWAAASAVLELFPQVQGRLRYRGGSFGGGIGALALPWDNRFAEAELEVPSFGNHPLRVTLPCVGSGESIRQLYQQRPQVLDVLQYFDAATAARHLRTRVHVKPALFDPAVPPPGQFAVYNGAAGEKKLTVLAYGHYEPPPDFNEGS